MGEVPREEFLPETMAEFAYEDSPLPIGEGQVISQPYIVAVMTELLALEKGDRFLEIGTGSGYAAAILSRIVDEVYTVERHLSFANAARDAYRRLGYDNIHVRHGDGSLGWSEHGPYDAIVVTAGAPEVPDTLKMDLSLQSSVLLRLIRENGWRSDSLQCRHSNPCSQRLRCHPPPGLRADVPHSLIIHEAGLQLDLTRI